MKTVALGKTGLEVSRLGFGCASMWGSKRAITDAHAIRLVHQAVDLGITLFDTGSSYCGGYAETRLGKALDTLDRSKLVIATKAGTQIGNYGRLYKDYSPQALTKNIDTSLARLGLDAVDILQLHSPHDPSMFNDDFLACLEGFKTEGKVRYIGVSCHGPVLDAVLYSGAFDVVMTTFNILDRSAAAQLKRAKALGLGTLIMTPMAQGLYSNDIYKVSSLADGWYLIRALVKRRELLSRGRRFRFVNELEGWTGGEVAMTYVLQSDLVDCAVTGTVRAHHLASNVACADKVLPPDVLRRIEAV